MNIDLIEDLAVVSRIASVPTILEVVALLTGMRFTAIARVTEAKWIAMAVHDVLPFGLEPGGELPLQSTICHEIRQHRQLVVFNDVDPTRCIPLITRPAPTD
jgi:hypothetical protein